MEEIKIGDVVTLKHSSVQMTVSATGIGMKGDEVGVVWFKDYEWRSAQIHPGALKKVKQQ